MADAAQGFSQFDITKEEIDKLRRPCSIGYQNYSQCAIPAHVISAAKEKLSNAFGYDLRELLRYRPSSAKSYVLISKLPAEVYKKYISFGITLKRMGLCETNVSHPPFGNAKYLQKDKVNGPKGNTWFYELADGFKLQVKIM
ncbi:MAGE domain-containing protein [Citrus sinensis]|uniref:MAGE domain-containing protein n=1 Tax=Citrus sinensis TaxID=2711 RepID=A0ACB8HV10_CITSI|nr:MAGE domain-containing protein [Citrus sinensis]